MKTSAGLLLFRQVENDLEVLIVHPGGPFYVKKDNGVWSVPKGEYEAGEEALVAAKREFEEELGRPAPNGELVDLGEAKQAGGKINHIWALASDFDESKVRSNEFEIEWPPKSGKTQRFPEVDRADWFSAGTAKVKLWPAQTVFIERLESELGIAVSEAAPENQQTTLL